VTSRRWYPKFGYQVVLFQKYNNSPSFEPIMGHRTHDRLIGSRDNVVQYKFTWSLRQIDRECARCSARVTHGFC